MLNREIITNLLIKIEKIFLSVGFEEIYINKKKYFCYDKFYCMVSYVEQLKAIVIETAEDKSEVLKNLFEDSGIYEVNENTNFDDIVEEIRQDLINYYIS